MRETLESIRKAVFSSDPRLLEDAVGGYRNKSVAFIGCNPHKPPDTDSRENVADKYQQWLLVNDRDFSIRCFVADQVAGVKSAAFKVYEESANPKKSWKSILDLIAATDTAIAQMINSFKAYPEVTEYLKFIARPNKSQFHFNVGAHFQRIIGNPSLKHSDVYRRITTASIFLEMFKFATPMKSDIPSDMLPDIDILMRQLDWLVYNDLKIIVLCGRDSIEMRQLFAARYQSKVALLQLPSFSSAANGAWSTKNANYEEVCKNVMAVWETNGKS